MDRRTAQIIRRVGTRVKRLRKERGYTAKAFAERAGLSLRFYAQLESGQANIAIGRLAAVADALDVPIAELVADKRGPKCIALLGLRGGGKSTLGPLIAQQLNLEFVELDAQIESEAGLSLSEVFALHGEQYYRRLEVQCLTTLLDSNKPTVVALSGGVVHNPDAFERVQRDCITVWLKANPKDHMQRVMAQGDHRPMADRENAMAELTTLLAAREPLYKQAELTLDTSSHSVPDAVTSLTHSIQGLGLGA